MRCIVQLDNQYHNDYIANAPSNYSSPLWIKNEEVNETKRHAKILSKQWRSSKNNTRAATTAVCPAGAAIDDDIIYDAVRCTEQGQSLRGLEHVTHQSIGRKRRLVKQTAIRAAVTEQRNQLVGHVLDTYYRAKDDEAVNGVRYESRAAEDRSSGDVIKMDGKKIAEAYGAEASEALDYARRVAREDAAVAAEILVEDFRAARNQILKAVAVATPIWWKNQSFAPLQQMQMHSWP